MFINCCHCTWCQRETGTAFALNALIETTNLTLLQGVTESVLTPSASGKGQTIVRCPTCRVAVWSHYPGPGTKLAFVRVGTLTDASRHKPNAFIFTSTKLPWVVLPADVPAFEEYYVSKELWPAESLARRQALL